MTETLTNAAPTKSVVRTGNNGLMLASMDDMWRFAQYVVSSNGFAPKGMEKAESVFVAVQMGFEVGLTPMQALQSIAVINGRPAIYGDAAKALVEASGMMEHYEQWYELNGKKLKTESGHNRPPTQAELKNDDLMACVLSKRKGREPMVQTFSIGDAKAAGLLGKTGPWSQYPARMLMFRARGFNLRDNFGDILKGLKTDDEVLDLPKGEVIEVVPVEDKLAALREASQKAKAAPPVAAEIVPQEAVVVAGPPPAKDKLLATIEEFEAAGGKMADWLQKEDILLEDLMATTKATRLRYIDKLAAATRELKGAAAS